MKSKKFILFFIIFLLILAFVKYWDQAYMAFDVSMYMVLAKLVLNGARPYVDIVDINPPLIFYIHVSIVWIADLIKSSPLELYDLTLLAANIGVAYFIARKFRALGETANYMALCFLLASLHALIAFQYGQREHLFMTFLIPYFCWRWLDGELKTVSFYAITLATGLLAFLKPGFFVILVAYELVLFVYRRKLVLKHWVLLGIPGAIYLVHFMFLPKVISDAFWLELVPIVWSRYWTMGLTASVMLEFWGPTVLCYMLLASLYLYIGLRAKDKRFSILAPIGICSFVAIAIAVLQGKGWEYHLIPAQVFLFFGISIAILALHQYVTSKLKLTLIGLFLFFLMGQHLYVLVRKAPLKKEHFIKECGNDDLRSIAPRGSSIVVFSIHPCFSYPIFYERSYVPGTRYVSLFPLAFFNFTPERLEMFKTHFPTEKDLSKHERGFVDKLKIDFKKKRPEFIIFPKNLVPEGFDPYRYAISTGVFPEVEKSYTLIQNNNRWRIYRRSESL